MKYGLGRLPSVDERDKQYPMTLKLSAQPTFFERILPWRYWKMDIVLDQGQTNQCVGYAWRAWLNSAPLMTKNGPSASMIYHRAQQLDEWPGEDYEGTSVRGGVKVLQEQKRVKTYLWAQTPEELMRWVLSTGPVVVGTNWYEDMMVTDYKGLVRPTGRFEGGHAYLVLGFNKITNRYRCLNSWGSEWGQRGRFWITRQHLELLVFGESGEACAAVEELPQ